MIEAARRRGYAYRSSRHSQSLAIARGPEPARWPSRPGSSPSSMPVRGARGRRDRAARDPARRCRLLHGCELEVRADGNLDFEDELLARFDLVVASAMSVVASPRPS